MPSTPKATNGNGYSSARPSPRRTRPAPSTRPGASTPRTTGNSTCSAIDTPLRAPVRRCPLAGEHADTPHLLHNGAMPSFLDRIRRGRVPTDAETAQRMLRLAEAFIKDAAAVGEVFTWESAEASRLDDICDELVATRPSTSRRREWVLCVGAYLGELLVRNGGGHWSYDPREKAAVVEMPNGLRGYPHNKVF